MGEKCIVCNKKFGMFDNVTYVTVDAKEKEIHGPCRSAFYSNPEKYGGSSSDKDHEMADKAIEQNYYDDRVKGMVIVTDASVAKKAIIETLGFVTGSTVRAKHVGSDIMAGMKSVVGGELKGYTELLANGRDEAVYRLKQDASTLGADAVISMRLTTSMVAVGAVEIMAYGTAVKFAEEV
jgi:uncharacterized protein YbjQ (UPF0145 family)